MVQEQKIYYLFNDGSIGYFKGNAFSMKPKAWKFELHHDWKFDNFPNNYYKSIG